MNSRLDRLKNGGLGTLDRDLTSQAVQPVVAPVLRDQPMGAPPPPKPPKETFRSITHNVAPAVQPQAVGQVGSNITQKAPNVGQYIQANQGRGTALANAARQGQLGVTPNKPGGLLYRGMGEQNLDASILDRTDKGLSNVPFGGLAVKPAVAPDTVVSDAPTPDQLAAYDKSVADYGAGFDSRISAAEKEEAELMAGQSTIDRMNQQYGKAFGANGGANYVMNLSRQEVENMARLGEPGILEAWEALQAYKKYGYGLGRDEKGTWAAYNRQRQVRSRADELKKQRDAWLASRGGGQ